MSCAAGKFKAIDGSTPCSECSGAKYSIAAGAASEDTCKTCPPNAVTTAGGTSCACDAGYSGITKDCTACVPGKFKAGIGDRGCSNCPAGEYSAKSAAIVCHDCPANTHAEAGSLECVCNAGYTGAHEACSACGAGKYKSASGSGACAGCEAGTFSTQVAAVACQACGHGATSAVGSTACECSAGFSGAADACAACAKGKYKPAKGSYACLECDAGSFAAAMASVSCDVCTQNSDSPAGSASCSCVAGYSGNGAGRRLLAGDFVFVCARV